MLPCSTATTNRSSSSATSFTRTSRSLGCSAANTSFTSCSATSLASAVSLKKCLMVTRRWYSIVVAESDHLEAFAADTQIGCDLAVAWLDRHEARARELTTRRSKAGKHRELPLTGDLASDEGENAGPFDAGRFPAHDERA